MVGKTRHIDPTDWWKDGGKKPDIFSPLWEGMVGKTGIKPKYGKDGGLVFKTIGTEPTVGEAGGMVGKNQFSPDSFPSGKDLTTSLQRDLVIFIFI